MGYPVGAVNAGYPVGGENVGPVGGVCCTGYGGMGAAAFVLVLFILLIIILRAGTRIY
jgi:hypothetical protein